jgi:large subunit ribosomal protein L29
MEMDKIANLDKEELALQAHQAAEQIFRLRFQLSMGQNEGLKKLRELKKDIARIQTVQRQRELGIAAPSHPSEPKPKRAAKKAAKSKSKSTKTKAAKGKGVKSKKLSKTSKKTSKAAGKAKAGKTSMKSAKRGKANAKKGGS